MRKIQWPKGEKEREKQKIKRGGGRERRTKKEQKEAHTSTKYVSEREKEKGKSKTLRLVARVCRQNYGGEKGMLSIKDCIHLNCINFQAIQDIFTRTNGFYVVLRSGATALSLYNYEKNDTTPNMLL